MLGEAARVFGPYQSGTRWRVVCVVAGARKSKIFDSRDAAQAAADSLRASLTGVAPRPIRLVLDQYLAHKRQQGLRAVSLRNLDCKLRKHLDQDAPLASIDPAHAQALYLGWTQQLAVATQRMLLRYVRGFFAWCVHRGELRQNPFAQVAPIGVARSGKPQLRVDEARLLYAHLQQQAQQGDDTALGLLLMLLLGLRSAEVQGLHVRDVDAQGSRLCVAMSDYPGKTAHAPRVLPVDLPTLRTELCQRRGDRAPSAVLLGAPHGVSSKRLRGHLERACLVLALPRICPHSLRGLHATLAIQQGATAPQVAAALGHGSPAISQRHYIAPGSEQVAHASRMAQLLAPAVPSVSPSRPAGLASAADVVLALLNSLGPDDRASVLAAIRPGADGPQDDQ